jgi:hypothetical protein
MVKDVHHEQVDPYHVVYHDEQRWRDNHPTIVDPAVKARLVRLMVDEHRDDSGEGLMLVAYITSTSSTHTTIALNQCGTILIKKDNID